MNEQASVREATGKRLAAIDLGSNSIRLLVAEVNADGTYRILDDEKQTTRLARGLANTGSLTKEAVSQSLETLSRLKAIAAGYDVERLEVIATSAVREAVNREEFLQLVRERLNLEVEIISPTEEGRLSFTSVARHFDLRSSNTVVMDLGGGSAELILVANGIIEEIYSLPLGAVRLTDSFIHSDPLSESDYRRLKKHVRKCFAEVIGKVNFSPQVMIGAGGSFTALANISLRRRGEVYSSVGGQELNRPEVRHIHQHLMALSLASRRAVPGLHADRADIILAGLIVIEHLMKLFHVNRLLIHDQGVRDGLMLRMIEQSLPQKTASLNGESNPLAGVRQFATACGVEMRHALQVAKLARELFEQLQAHLPCSPSDSLILEAAAILHEVGYLINYEKHHQHSYHLILHGNLRGLTPKQRELVANVARYHRRSGPKRKHENFARLSPQEQETVRRLSAILRLADGLDRTHMQRVHAVRCRWHKNLVYVTVIAEQLPDVDLWGARQKGKLIEKDFGVKLKFGWELPAESKGQTN